MKKKYSEIQKTDIQIADNNESAIHMPGIETTIQISLKKLSAIQMLVQTMDIRQSDGFLPFKYLDSSVIRIPLFCNKK